jgi:Icc protein
VNDLILIQLTDLHCRPHGQPAMRVCETNMLTERALRAVAAFSPKPDAVLITGDLTDAGTAPEYRTLAEMLGRLIDVPVYVIPGNHDRRELVRAELGHLPGVTADPHFVQYVVDDLPVRLVMLDTVAPGFGHGELCAERMAWLEATLASVPHKPTLIGMHHPPFLCGMDMDRIALRDIAGFTALIARHPQVKRIVCGRMRWPRSRRRWRTRWSWNCSASMVNAGTWNRRRSRCICGWMARGSCRIRSMWRAIRGLIRSWPIRRIRAWEGHRRSKEGRAPPRPAKGAWPVARRRAPDLAGLGSAQPSLLRLRISQGP